MMDSMCVRVQDHLNSLRFSEVASVQEDLKVAENLMKDAKNSKTLLPNLYHLRGGAGGGASGVGGGGAGGPCISAIQEKLQATAGEVAAVVEQQLQVSPRPLPPTCKLCALTSDL